MDHSNQLWCKLMSDDSFHTPRIKSASWIRIGIKWHNFEKFLTLKKNKPESSILNKNPDMGSAFFCLPLLDFKLGTCFIRVPDPLEVFRWALHAAWTKPRFIIEKSCRAIVIACRWSVCRYKINKSNTDDVNVYKMFKWQNVVCEPFYESTHYHAIMLTHLVYDIIRNIYSYPILN